MVTDQRPWPVWRASASTCSWSAVCRLAWNCGLLVLCLIGQLVFLLGLRCVPPGAGLCCACWVGWGPRVVALGGELLASSAASGMPGACGGARAGQHSRLVGLGAPFPRPLSVSATTPCWVLPPFGLLTCSAGAAIVSFASSSMMHLVFSPLRSFSRSFSLASSFLRLRLALGFLSFLVYLSSGLLFVARL